MVEFGYDDLMGLEYADLVEFEHIDLVGLDHSDLLAFVYTNVEDSELVDQQYVVMDSEMANYELDSSFAKI